MSNKKADRLTAAQRAMYGQEGAALARSRHHPRDTTQAARKAFLDRFEAQVRAADPALPADEVIRRAAELKRAYFLRLAVASSRARAKGRS